MAAAGRSWSWRSKKALSFSERPVFSASSARMAFSSLCFISLAAALVNVVIRNLSTSTCSSMMSFLMRSISTVVLPDPAAADTRIFLSLSSIVFF